MRFGLVGTGYWARVTHGAVLAREPSVELVAVWDATPARLRISPRSSALPPLAITPNSWATWTPLPSPLPRTPRPTLAARAAEGGKHLLLDKPLATSVAGAERLVEAVDRAGVSSVVFFTGRFSQPIRQWLAQVAADRWTGAWARWIVFPFAPGSPYASSPWRREKGALWDVGPHALSMLTAALGPVEAVTADGGTGDLVHLTFHHAGGATSTASLTLNAPPAAVNVELCLWGPQGVSTMPRGGSSTEDAYAIALGELLSNIAAGESSHPCDVHFGAAIVRTLADAEGQIASRRRLVIR